jgi:hypothetical protein
VAQLDHVTIAVRDLESAAAAFSDDLGFSLKPGRVHENGLRNVHIRFTDGSAIELLTTGDGVPDELSESYERFLSAGDGGAYLALRAGPVEAVLGRLEERAVEARVTRGKAFDWVAFPMDHPLHRVYFIHVHTRPPDLPEQLDHANGATGLSAVWVETRAPRALEELLVRFGADACGEVATPEGPAGRGYGLRGGAVVVVPAAQDRTEPRVRAVSIASDRARQPARVSGVLLSWTRWGT